MSTLRTPPTPSPATPATRTLLALAAGLATGLASAAAASPPDVHTIVVSGTPAPGFPAGVALEFISSPRINNAGDLAFWARLGGPATTDPKLGSIWSIGPGGGLVRLVATGDQSPFDPAFHLMAPIDPGLDAAGGVSFYSTFTNVPAPTHFTPAPGGLFLVDDAGTTSDLGARDGAADPLPAAPGNTLVGVLPSFMGAPGVVVFVAGNPNPAAAPLLRQGLWSATTAGPDLIARREAEQGAPGFPPTDIFRSFDLPVQGAPGSLVFRATVDVASPVMTVPGLWTDRSGELALLAKRADPAPGVPGATFADFGNAPLLDAAGRATFSATLAGDAVTPDTDTGIWTERSGALAPLVLENSPAPGAAPALFASLSRHPAVNPSSDIALTATLRGDDTTPTNNSGLWLYPADGAAPRLIAREGDQVGGMPAGVRFAVLHDPALNARADLAFLARLRGDEGAGVTPTNNVALLVADRCGNITPIARTGHPFTVAPAGGPPVEKTVAEIIFDTGSLASGRAQFNDLGTLVFTLRFTDGASGLFSATTYARTDINRDGTTNSGDISAFLTAWIASITDGTLAGDFNADGVVNSGDISVYLTAWIAALSGGC